MLRTCIYVLFMLGYLAQGAVVQSDPANQSFGTRAAISVETICLKNADESTLEQAMVEFHHIKSQCWTLSFLRESQSDDETSRLCMEHRENMIQCVTKFIKKFEPCLGAEESGLGQFLLNAYGNYSNYLCDHILEIIPDKMEVDALKCIAQFVQDPSIDPSQVCYENSEVFGSNSSDVVVTKAKLCGDLQKARTCYGEKFGKHCPDVPKLKELILNLLQEALIPCQDVLEDGVAKASQNAVEGSE